MRSMNTRRLRQLRRKDKQVTSPEEIEAIIRKASVLRIALHDDPFPYLVPVNFGYADGQLFFHSASQGKKIDLIRRNNRVCFESESDFGLIRSDTPCHWSARYASVIGFGRAHLIEDREGKKRGLEIILRHYSVDPLEIPDTSLAPIVVVRIEVESMTGKVSPKPQETAADRSDS
jgi:uncharacterized protein